MKKLVLCLVVGLFLAGLVGCGSGGKYGEVRDTTEDMIDAMTSFGEEMEKAEDGEEVADAVSDFVDEFAGIRKKIDKLEKEFPEFDINNSLPEELKDLKPKIKEAMMKTMEAMMKIRKFRNDPAVEKIEDKLDKLKKLGRGM